MGKTLLLLFWLDKWHSLEPLKAWLGDRLDNNMGKHLSLKVIPVIRNNAWFWARSRNAIIKEFMDTMLEIYVYFWWKLKYECNRIEMQNLNRWEWIGDQGEYCTLHLRQILFPLWCLGFASDVCLLTLLDRTLYRNSTTIYRSVKPNFCLYSLIWMDAQCKEKSWKSTD